MKNSTKKNLLKQVKTNKATPKKKKVMSDKAYMKLIEQQKKKVSKFKYNVRKDKTMKKCHNFCKNDYLQKNFYEKLPSVKSFKSEEEKKRIEKLDKSFKEMIQEVCIGNFCNEGCAEGFDFDLFSGNVKENLQKNFQEKFSKKLYNGFIDSYSAKEVDMLKKRGALSGCGDL